VFCQDGNYVKSLNQREIYYTIKGSEKRLQVYDKNGQKEYSGSYTELVEGEMFYGTLNQYREYINPNLSIGENNWLKNAISIYPNPASALINISALEGVEVHSIMLYSALGQQILSAEGVNSIDVSILPSGVYYMTIETDQGSVNKTLVRK